MINFFIFTLAHKPKQTGVLLFGLVVVIGLELIFIPKTFGRGLPFLKDPNLFFLVGSTGKALENEATILKEKLETLPGVKAIDIRRPPLKQHRSLRLDKNRLAYFGISPAMVGKTVAAAVDGVEAARFFKDGKEWGVRVGLKESDKDSVHHLNNLFFKGKSGTLIPLRSFAEVQFVERETQLKRLNRRRVLALRVTATSKKKIEAILERLESDDVEVVFGDGWHQKKSFLIRFSILVMGALGLLVLLLAVQFESFRVPFLILGTVPFSLLGALTLLLLTGNSLNLISALGILILFGLTVNNGIVLVSFIRKREKQGERPVLDVVQEAAELRRRPVLMTATTTIVGLLPLSIKGFQTPAAISIIGGMITSTALTLVLVPALYLIFHRKG